MSRLISSWLSKLDKAGLFVLFLPNSSDSSVRTERKDHRGWCLPQQGVHCQMRAAVAQRWWMQNMRNPDASMQAHYKMTPTGFFATAAQIFSVLRECPYAHVKQDKQTLGLSTDPWA